MQKGVDDDEDESVKPSWSQKLSVDLHLERSRNFSTSLGGRSQTLEHSVETAHDVDEATSDMLPLKSISRWPLFVSSWLLKKVERFNMEAAVAVFNTNDSG